MPAPVSATELNAESTENTSLNSLSLLPIGWPEAPAPEAFHGIVGKVWQVLEPYTEADPMAFLASMLVAAGCFLGRSVYYTVEGTNHYPNLFAAIVGRTSSGRKGTSLDRAIQVLKLGHDDIATWLGYGIASGLASGEGLIHLVRDPIYGRSKGGGEEILDPGVLDKRLLVQATEFSHTMQVQSRQGSTLSPVLRESWDGKNLRVASRNSPLCATDPSIAVVAHMVPDELREGMYGIQASNGYANRFLFICSERSKLLPFGGEPLEAELHAVAQRLGQILVAVYARGRRRIEMNAATREAWVSIYPELARGHENPRVDSATSRAHAQVLRLALLYCALDNAEAITTEHLKAAIAIWEYSEASAKYLFGRSESSMVEDTILKALAARGTLTTTALWAALSNHTPKNRLQEALARLQKTGAIRRQEDRSGPGRPATSWSLVVEPK